MILSYNQLCDIIDSGFITHVLPDNINGSSIDVRIGDEVLIERYAGSPDLKTISLRNREPMNTVTHHLLNEPLYLYPGECILAHTIEMFNLPADLSAMFKLKSSCGRIFLEHMNAGWCDAYWHGSALTMELKNMSRQHCIKLEYGDAIGQMIFFPHQPVPEDMGYARRGRYNKDRGVSGTKKAVLVFGDPEEDEANAEIAETMEKPFRNIETGRLETAVTTRTGESDDD